MSIVAELLALVALFCAYFLWSRRRFYMCALKMKGPWGYPLLGIVHKLRKLEDILYVLPRIAKEYKQKSYFTWFGPFPVVYTIDPELAEMVLQSPDCLNKTSVYSAIDDAGGSGLLTSKSARWKKHRKLLNPCFGYKVLLELIPTFNCFARKFCGEIDEHASCGEVDIHEIALKIGLKSAITTAMGEPIEEDSNAKVLESFESVFEFIISRMMKPWLRSLTVYSWTSAYKSFMEARDCIRYFIQDFVTAKLSSLDTKGSEKDSHVFINQVIKLHQEGEFSLDDVVFETSLMVIAGYETTGRTMFSTLLFLAMNPQLQERVFDEISAVFVTKDFNVSSDDLKQLVYLEMCINETLRLTPSIPIIGRVCDKDLPISKDVTIPAGTEIYIDIFSIHRDEDVWGPAAKTFNPDHFLPSNLEDKHKCAFLPFSRGKRNCLGWQYSMMFMRVMLAHVLRNFKFSTNFRFEDIQFKECISLKYVTTPLLKVERR